MTSADLISSAFSKRGGGGAGIIPADIRRISVGEGFAKFGSVVYLNAVMIYWVSLSFF